MFLTILLRNVTVIGPNSSHVQIPLPICLPCIDPALSLIQAGNFEEISFSNNNLLIGTLISIPDT